MAQQHDLRQNRAPTHSYKDPPVPELPKVKSPLWDELKMASPYATIFGIMRKQGYKPKIIDRMQFIPLQFISFIMCDAGPCFRMDILSSHGIEKAVVHKKADVIHPEFWMSAIRGYEDELIEKGFISQREKNKYTFKHIGTSTLEIEEKQEVYHCSWVHCNHINKCKCDQYKRMIKGELTAHDPHIYYPELDPERLFNCTQSMPGIPNPSGWVQETQICVNNDKYIEPSIPSIVLDNIRRSILDGSTSYLTSGLLSDDQYTLDVDIKSSLFGKFNLFQSKPELTSLIISGKETFDINKSRYIVATLIGHLLEKNFAQKVDSEQFGIQMVSMHRILSNVLKSGVFVDELRMDTVLLPFMILFTAQIYIKYLLKTIDFGIDHDFLINELKMSDVIKKYSGGGQTHLRYKMTKNGDSKKLYISYIREESVLFLQSFGYENKNKFSVEADQVINSNTNNNNNNSQ